MKMEKTPSFFTSTRGSKKLTLEGFIYGKDKHDTKSGKTYWKCELRSCKGRIITASDNRILKESSHNHGPDKPQIELQKSMARLKEMATSTDECPARLLNKELMTTFPSEFRGYWPKEASIKRTIQRQRRKILPTLPKCLEEIHIEESWQLNSRGEQWLLCDRSEGNDRLIIFCTERCLMYLCNSPVWYGDGTFSVAPSFFYQLYTLHGVVMGQLLPLAYCILTRKSKEIYTQMFMAISDFAAVKVDKHHPNIYTFLEKLKGEQAHTETRIERLIAGAAPKELRKKEKTTNEKLLNIIQNFRVRPHLDFLKGVAYNFRY